MLLFCPLCQSAFTGVARCPRCSGLLLMPEEAPPGTEPGEAAPEPFNPTPAGRVAVGTIVALGLYLALRKLVTGWVILEGNEAEDWWRSGDALLTVFILQMTAAAFGALLALPERSFYPYYDRIASHLGANAAGEQAAAGGIMWVSGHMYLFPILLVLYNFAQRNARVEAR